VGKPVQTIQAIVSQGTTVPKGTVGTIESYVGQDDSAISNHPNIECNAIKIVFTDPAITVSIPIDQLGSFVEDVPFDTPVTP
jgi:hypothetical protein